MHKESEKLRFMPNTWHKFLVLEATSLPETRAHHLHARNLHARNCFPAAWQMLQLIAVASSAVSSTTNLHHVHSALESERCSLIHLLQSLDFLLQLSVLQRADLYTLLQPVHILLLLLATHFGRYLHYVIVQLIINASFRNHTLTIHTIWAKQSCHTETEISSNMHPFEHHVCLAVHEWMVSQSIMKRKTCRCQDLGAFRWFAAQRC